MIDIAPTLLLEGRSGCKLEVYSEKRKYIVRKYSKEPNYNQRLLLQAAKQQTFKSLGSLFKVPLILDKSSDQAPLTWFDMEYVHGQKYSEYLERLSISEIKSLADSFYNYFLVGLNSSEKVNPDRSLFLNKIESVATALEGRVELSVALIQKSINYLKNIPEADLPIGNCHGDFTFSNMLFSEAGIYLVDFLDSFLESPLIDLVKFRQDTFFYWTLSIDRNFPSGRIGKIIQIFRYLDHEIFSRLFFLPEVKSWYVYLQVFNLLRILPYVGKPHEIEFVQSGISKLLNTTNK
jgi:aminoglycoside phosphotransferase (APT) family kinase protein